MGEGAVEESEVTGRLGRFNRKFVVEEMDWMREAEGISPVVATTRPPSQKKGDAS